MATNLDSDQFTDHQMVQFYNQRAATSENRIKALRSDFAAAQPPCGEFDAHAVDFQFGAIVCNLLALMRLMLPAAWESCRTPTIRYRLYALAGQIVGPSRPLMLNIDRPRTKQFEEALWSIRPCVLR